MISLIRASAGLIVWAGAFSLLYALHGIGCSARWPTIAVTPGITLHRLVLIVAWLLCIGAGLALVMMTKGARSTLLDRLARRSSIVGLAATIVTGLPVLLLPDCL